MSSLIKNFQGLKLIHYNLLLLGWHDPNNTITGTKEINEYLSWIQGYPPILQPTRHSTQIKIKTGMYMKITYTRIPSSQEYTYTYI